MCGILGTINLPLDANKIKHLLFHRGPDEQNSFSEQNLHLYHFRLSILDAQGGKQPMQFAGRYTIIYNGEIYNHQELRRKYKLNCHTNSDTETILHLYDKLGTKCFDEFDGMFAIALYDNVNRELVLVRDRAGKKPLYYYQNNNIFAFASELNSLNAIFPLSIDESNINAYLHSGIFFSHQTPYKEIAELENGGMLKINIDTLKIHKQKWWSIENIYASKVTDDFETVTLNIDRLINQSVIRRLESSDLEVGSFLSGGIDSGIITAIAAQNHKKLKTFTVSFDGQYDEAPLAKLVASRYGTDHKEISISFDTLKYDIEKILCNYGEPFMDSSAIPSYYVSQKAKEYVTVILNGDGGDEMFGGYRRYVLASKINIFNKNPSLRHLFEFLFKAFPKSNDKKKPYGFFYRSLDILSKKQLYEKYITATSDCFSGYENNFTFGKLGIDAIKEYTEAISLNNWSTQAKMLCLDFNIFLFSDLLPKMDIATMAHSIEGRSPFLGKDLLEYVPSINEGFKIKGTTTKYILRQLAKKYLPYELVNQPKRGFEIPLKKWVDGELKDIIYSYLLPKNAYIQNYIKPAFIVDLLENNTRLPQEKRAKMLWSLFALEIWYQKVYKDSIKRITIK